MDIIIFALCFWGGMVLSVIFIWWIIEEIKKPKPPTYEDMKQEHEFREKIREAQLKNPLFPPNKWTQ